MAENGTTARTSASRYTQVSDRLQHLRNLLSSERQGNNEQRRAMEALDREMAEMEAEPISARLERRRRELEGQIQDVNTALPSESPTTGTPSGLIRSRRRVIRPSERLMRYRERMLNQTEGMQETSAPSERPPPPIEPSEVAIQEYLDEAEVNRENRWRAKRRKLDDGTFEDESKTFAYGHKGQVVEGSLKLEIVSCDGGEYSEAGGTSIPQHALQDDSSVYCTKSNRCNMLLKHIGGMPFSLTKIVVKAPDDGYDAPIQEGMVFVSLDDEKLLEKTSQYEIRYSPRSYRYYHTRPRDTGNSWPYRPSHDYLHSNRSPLRSIDRSSYPRDPHPEAAADTDCFLETALVPGFNVTTTFDSDSEHEHEREHAQSATRSSYSYGAEFDVTRLLRAHREGDHYRPAYAAPPPRLALGRESESDESSDSDEHQDPHDAPEALYESHDLSHRHQRMIRMAQAMREQQRRDSEDRWSREYFDAGMEVPGTNHTAVARAMVARRETPSRVELRRSQSGSAEADTASGDGETETQANGVVRPATPVGKVVAVGKEPEPLAPHARFFIRRDKSTVTIKFNPPVAGRYILIKLWAPCPNANIDIQSIVAHGYGGPRVLPLCREEITIALS